MEETMKEQYFSIFEGMFCSYFLNTGQVDPAGLGDECLNKGTLAHVCVCMCVCMHVSVLSDKHVGFFRVFIIKGRISTRPVRGLQSSLLVYWAKKKTWKRP